MRRTLLLVITLMCGALAPVAASQEPATPAPSPAFRVIHYDLKAEITPATRSLEAAAGVTIEPLGPDLRTLRLYLYREFTVRHVADSGRALTFTQPKGTGDTLMFSPDATPLDIDLGRALASGERLTLLIDYGGPISKTINNVNVISPALTELASYAAWFPKEKENGAFTYHLTVTLPADHAVAVTDGREIRTSTSGTSITHVFRRDQESFDIPLVSGPGLKLSERRVGETLARVVFRNLDETAALASLDGAIQCAQAMERQFGQPTAAGAITVVFSPRSGWGYSRVPLIVGPEEATATQLESPSGRTAKFRGLAHEAAHFWWNLARTSTSDDWLNEAFAEYSALRAVEAVADADTVADLWQGQSTAANKIPPGKTVLGTLRNDPHAYATYYQKGALVLRTLEAWIGRPALDRILVAFYRAHRGRRDATTDGFLAAVRAETGSRFDAYFDRVLRRGGLPEVTVTWSVAPGKAGGTVALDDAALAGFPLTLRFTGEGTAVDRTVTLAQGETAWQFDLPFDPVDVVIDPEWRMLRRDADVQYSARLLPLMHGPDMDALPRRIPRANVGQASAILDEWAASGSRSVALDFERGWLALVEGRPADAIRHLSAVLPRVGSLPNPTFSVPATYSALGRSYDLAGDRENALGCYREGLRRSAQLGVAPGHRINLFQNFLETPYPVGESVHYIAMIGEASVLTVRLTDSPGLVHARDPYLGLPPVVWAVRGRPKRPVIQQLVDAGADLNVRDEKGRTLLEIVRATGDTELAGYLVSRGAR